MRPRLLAAALLLFGLTSCTPPAAQPAIASPTAMATPTPIRHEIRFGLVGTFSEANVWGLFDKNGYSYNNYAVRRDYWTRLYRLSIPTREFEPLAASGMPSAIVQEGNFYTGSVGLRSDLTWNDGTPFTAEDVVFTVNAVLAFQLGFDWHDAYDPDWIDHAESLDAHTVKFYFKKQPNISAWQYGVLQGPIVQKAYWSPRIAASAALLPASTLTSRIEALNVQAGLLQKQFDTLNAALTPPAALSQVQSDLNHANTDLGRAQADFTAAMLAARDSLYGLSDTGEPRLGLWQAEKSPPGTAINIFNPQFSIDHAGVDRAVYQFYPSEDAAVASLVRGAIDEILEPNGLAGPSQGKISSIQKSVQNPDPRLRFLIFNPSITGLRNPAFRQALACMIDQDQLIKLLGGQAAALESFILPLETYWYNAAAIFPCKGMDSAARLSQAVSILKSAGYRWTQEPAAGRSGAGLTLPDESAYPAITLLSPASDPGRVTAAMYIQAEARLLGVPLTAYPVSADQIDYAVFSDQNYDLAILGWKVGAYPGYLCDWFGPANPIHYSGYQETSLCEAFQSTSDLVAARQQVLELQSALMRDLPFIPLFSGLTTDVYQNVSYPFDSILGGLSEIYGAPSLAIPASH